MRTLEVAQAVRQRTVLGRGHGAVAAASAACGYRRGCHAKHEQAQSPQACPG